MTFRQWYWRCFRSVPGAAWAAIATISTVATFAAAGAGYWQLIDSEKMNSLILIVLLVALFACLLVAPLTQAFRVYQEKERELAEERRRQAEELATIRGEHESNRLAWNQEGAQLRRQVDALRSDPRRALIRHEMQSFVKRFESIDGQTATAGQVSMREFRQLVHEVKNYLRNHLPEYKSFAADIVTDDPNHFEHAVEAQVMHARCQKCLDELRLVLQIIDGEAPSA